VLVDARAQERYAGNGGEPIDPVAGHIPGAVNHPFTANLGEDGRFSACRRARASLDRNVSPARPENLVAMCGSGVTACHNLLSLEVAASPAASCTPDPGRRVGFAIRGGRSPAALG